MGLVRVLLGVFRGLPPSLWTRVEPETTKSVLTAVSETLSSLMVITDNQTVVWKAALSAARFTVEHLKVLMKEFGVTYGREYIGNLAREMGLPPRQVKKKKEKKS